MADYVIYGFLAAYLLSFAIGAYGYDRRPTILSFFWGNQNLSPNLVAHLILTNSFSLNGILYQTWLGYSIGWWALGIQFVWCLGYILLAAKADRIAQLINAGTLHGIIGTRFGTSGELMSSIASTIGFTAMIGWETVVGAILLAAILQSDNKELPIALALIVALIASLYTMLGGIRGDAKANLAQNVIKAALLLIVTVLLFVDHTPLSNLASPPIAFPPYTKMLSVLTISGLVTNLIFSAAWQYADMSTWQSISAARALTLAAYPVPLSAVASPHAVEGVSTSAGRAIAQRYALQISALAAFLFPGVVGTAIGIGLASITDLGPVSDNNILAALVRLNSAYPALILGILFAFALAMLSTIDGYALAAGQAVTWDMLFSKNVRSLLALPAVRKATDEDLKIITVARLIIVAAGILGASIVTYLVFSQGLSLFNIVYFVVIAQMTLVPVVLYCLCEDSARVLSGGWLPIAFGLVTGFGLAFYAIAFGNDFALNVSSVTGLFASAIGVFALHFLPTGGTKS